MSLLQMSAEGLYCAQADVHIDPWLPVRRALITHAHSDHARWGSKHYLCARRGEKVLRIRLGEEASIESLPWGQSLVENGVSISFHPAGHILGSAQIRLEYRGEVAVVSGDYKTAPDSTCDAFEPVRCHLFVTESTFGLPIYRWQPEVDVFREVHQWWQKNSEERKTSIVFAYALGKAQRLLAGLDPAIGPIAAHGSVLRLNIAYVEEGVRLPNCLTVTAETLSSLRGKGLIVAPRSVQNTPWLRKFAPFSIALASGWMMVRGQRRRSGVDRGFVISDHADWHGLLGAIRQTGAQQIWVTHGSVHPFVRRLRELGYEARPLETRFDPDGDEQSAEEV